MAPASHQVTLMGRMMVSRVGLWFLGAPNPVRVSTLGLILALDFLESVTFTHLIILIPLGLMEILHKLALMVMAQTRIFLCQLAPPRGNLTLVLVIMFVGILRLCMTLNPYSDCVIKDSVTREVLLKAIFLMDCTCFPYRVLLFQAL